MRSFRLLLPAILVGGSCLSSLALAGDNSTAILTLHNQQFDPDMLIVPAGIKVKIVIRNLDSIPDEFESYDLSREVFVPAHGEVAIYVGPLNPGNYQIFNDFNLHMEGLIMAKPVVKNGN